MWEPRRLTTPWACTAWYRDSFTFTLPLHLRKNTNFTKFVIRFLKHRRFLCIKIAFCNLCFHNVVPIYLYWCIWKNMMEYLWIQLMTFFCWFLAWLLIRPWRWRRYFFLRNVYSLETARRYNLEGHTLQVYSAVKLLSPVNYLRLIRTPFPRYSYST
jgi:hypothetical protein